MKIKIPFCGGGNKTRSINVNTERTLNCFVEMDNASPRAPVALYGTPGLRKVLTLATFPVRGIIANNNLWWVVSGNSVYKVTASYVVTLIGTINTNSGQVSMALNGSQIIIVDGTNGYLVTIATNSIVQITDPDFPNGVRQASYDDGYFLVAGNGSQSFYISKLLDGSSWEGLDFASAEGSPDNTIGLIVSHREVWLFGDNSAEIWVNTGNSAFPFDRTGNAFIEYGCASASTIQKLDSTVYWLGGGDTGSGMVWRANGYTPFRISDHALEFAIAGYGDVSNAYAVQYQQEGHSFYIITFPTVGKTWCYDVSTQLWHERSYVVPSSGLETQWRPSCVANIGTTILAGDYNDGRIYILDLDYYKDDTDNIKRLRSAIPQSQNQDRLFYEAMHVDMESGVGLPSGDPVQLMLRYSNDSGHTWSNTKFTSVGASGQYKSRARFLRLGSSRNRVWEISLTDPVKFVVLGAYVSAKVGIN
tara:strand:- start:623 stop:2047 length:1425 start_codon:yes stop_codon:yes gene_type:complete